MAIVDRLYDKSSDIDIRYASDEYIEEKPFDTSDRISSGEETMEEELDSKYSDVMDTDSSLDDYVFDCTDEQCHTASTRPRTIAGDHEHGYPETHANYFEEGVGNVSGLSDGVSRLGFGECRSPQSKRLRNASFYDCTQTPRKICFTTEPLSTSDDTATLLTIKRMEGWDEHHLTLLAHLHNRGKERILPVSFKRALHFMPDGIFATGSECPILGSRNTSAFQGEKHLTTLLKLGGYMRSSILEDSRPEKQLDRFLKPYVRWAMKDAGPNTRHLPPTVAVVMASAKSAETLVQTKIFTLLQHIATRHGKVLQCAHSPHEALQFLPSLYVILAIGTTVVLSVYKASLGHKLHSVATFDFSKPEQDVWNSIALALVVCHARDVQISLGSTTYHLFESMEVDSSSDPDA